MYNYVLVSIQIKVCIRKTTHFAAMKGIEMREEDLNLDKINENCEF